MDDWPTFSPSWASHVVGRIEPRVWDHEAKKHDPQRVVMVCDLCKTQHEVLCEQGRPREHVLTFARVHLHQDALAPAKLVP